MKRKRILAMLLSVSMVLSATSYAMAVEIPEGGSYESVESDTRSVEMDNNGEIDEEVFEENAEENAGNQNVESFNEEPEGEKVMEESEEASGEGEAEEPGESSGEGEAEEPGESLDEGTVEESGESSGEGEAEESGESLGETEESEESSGEGTVEEPGEASNESTIEESAGNFSEMGEESLLEKPAETVSSGNLNSGELSGGSTAVSSAAGTGNVLLSIETPCEECGKIGGHLDTCSLNLETRVRIKDMTGKTGKIIEGALIYASPSNASPSREVLFDKITTYSITIEEQLVDEDDAVWYRYSCSNLWAHLFPKYFKEYPYIREEDVEFEVVSGDWKQMTAEEIYDQWDEMTPEEKKDALDYLRSKDSDKYNELNEYRFPDLEDEVRDKVVIFADLTETLPETEIVNYYDASQALYWAWGPIPVDSQETPEEEQEAFQTAEAVLAEAMGNEGEAIALAYEAWDAATASDAKVETGSVKEQVNDVLLNMIYAYYDAVDAYGDDFVEYLEENSPETLDIYNTLAEYVEWDSQTFAENIDDSNEWGQLTSNIEVHLFDYGKKINDAEYALLDMKAGHADEVEGGLSVTDNQQGFPLFTPLKKYSNDSINYSGGEWVEALKDGYPYVHKWESGSNAVGSWQYLFDKNLEYVSGDGGDSAYSSQSSNYERVHFPVEELRLFQVDEETNTYTYDSRYNAAYYNPEDGSLTSYDYALRVFNVGSSASGQGSFLPFNKVTEDGILKLTEEELDEDGNVQIIDYSSENWPSNTYDNKTVTMTKVSSLDEIQKGNELATLVPNLYALNGGENNRSDLAFGMSIEFDFNMPEGGMVKNKGAEEEAPMVFEFRGDDDVVVFIDGYPVLNLGGPRPATKGTIDFHTGKVTVYKQASADEIDEARTTTLKEIFGWSGNQETFDDYTTHSLKFFYMERYGDASNCFLKFNMEPLPKGNLSVKKEETNLNEAFTGKTVYEFELLKKGENGEEVPVSGAEFTVTDAEGLGNPNTPAQGSSGCTTDSEGKFKLKHNQMATFTSGITVNDELMVKELVTDELSGRFITAYKVNSESTTEGSSTDWIEISDPNDRNDVVFTNEWDTADLTVTKDVNGKEHPDKKYSFTLNLGGFGSSSEEETIEQLFELAKGESKTLEDIPVGLNYKLSEADPSCNHESEGDSCTSDCLGYSYQNPLYQLNGEEKLEIAFDSNWENTILKEGNTVVVTNRCKADLKIVKILNDNVKPDQSFKFYIANTSGSVQMDIIIESDEFENGTASVTVKDMELDTYTITEDTDWSWRYELSTNDQAEKQVTLGSSGKVIFNNERKNDDWFDFENWCQNIFQGTGIIKGDAVQEEFRENGTVNENERDE